MHFQCRGDGWFFVYDHVKRERAETVFSILIQDHRGSLPCPSGPRSRKACFFILLYITFCAMSAPGAAHAGMRREPCRLLALLQKRPGNVRRLHEDAHCIPTQIYAVLSECIALCQ